MLRSPGPPGIWLPGAHVRPRHHVWLGLGSGFHSGRRCFLRQASVTPWCESCPVWLSHTGHPPLLGVLQLYIHLYQSPDCTSLTPQKVHSEPSKPGCLADRPDTQQTWSDGHSRFFFGFPEDRQKGITVLATVWLIQPTVSWGRGRVPISQLRAMRV